MDKRITIICSKKDKIKVIDALGYCCPFDPYMENCGEDADCGECMDENIDFVELEDRLEEQTNTCLMCDKMDMAMLQSENNILRDSLQGYANIEGVAGEFARETLKQVKNTNE